MLSRRAKAAYYAIAGPMMYLNGMRYRAFSAPRQGTLKVHLGPGQRNYIDGWLNVDANRHSARCDLWADLRNPLPLRDETVDCFYSHHVIEHLPSLEAHLADTFRCLKPGGVYRLGGPNGDGAIAKFVANDAPWFSDFPDARSSIGGRFENFVFCRGEHLTILTRSYLEELLTQCGFTRIETCLPATQTLHPHWFEPCLLKEGESDFETPHTLVLEAVKPFQPA